MKNEIIKGLDNEAYHANHEYVSKSMLDHLRKNPAKLQEYLRAGSEQTKAMRFGSMVHSRILEPFNFSIDFVVSPNFDRRTKNGKEAASEFEAANSGKEVITYEEAQTVKAMHEGCLLHREASRLLKATGEVEISLFSELQGVPVKARFDKLIDNKMIVDLKTTEDASIIEFGKSVWNYRYHVQAAFYIDVAASLGINIEKFFFVAVEKSAPHCVAVYQLDEDALNIGRREYIEQLALYKSCKELDSWPAYGQEIETLSLPKWALNK